MDNGQGIDFTLFLQKAMDFFFYAVNALWPCFVMVIGTFISFGLLMFNRKIIINHWDNQK